MEYNCGFTNENKWFRYRAAAIIVEDGYEVADFLYKKMNWCIFNNRNLWR